MADHKYPIFRLKIKALTWNRESNGLFDYETKNHTHQVLKLSEESYIIRNQDKIFPISRNSDNDLPENSKILVSFTKTGKNYVISSSNLNNDKEIEFEKSWLVIKGLKNPEYLLSEGDIIRLGKVKLKIHEIFGIRQNDTNRCFIHSKNIQNGGIGCNKTLKTGQNLSNITNESKDSVSCRICLNDDIDLLNPLISPCYCAGTMGIIHVKCLQQ